MTLAPDILTDPAQQAWEEASRDPLEALSAGERSEAQQLIDQADTSKGDLAAAALILGGAFLLYRSYMARRLAHVVTPNITRVALQTASDYYWRRFFPAWAIVASGALHGAGSAALDLQTGDVPDELLFALADDYAQRLGRYMHATTNQALVEGFSANLNKRLPRQMAAKRAIEGFGLSQRQMRALQATKTPPPVNSVQDFNPDVRSQAYIDQALVTRARQIGDNEAFGVSQEGRQLGWMYQLSKGRLPEGTRRMWLTARDERVCSVCGPLNHTTVELTKPFKTANGLMWAPGAHPNCRCEISLKVPVTRDAFIKKDLYGTALSTFNELHPRAHDGQFKTKTAKPPTVPTVKTVPQIPTIPTVAQVPTVARVEAAAPQVTQAVPQVTIPSVTMLQAIAAIPEAKVAIAQAVQTQAKAAPAVPQVKTEQKTKTTVSYRMGIAPRYAVNDFLSGDETQKRFTETRFTGYDKALSYAQDLVEQMIEDETTDLYDRMQGQPVTLRAPNGHAYDVDLTRDEVRSFVEAEVYGLPDSPGREIARSWGVDREDYTVEVYEVREIDTSRNSGDVAAYADNDEYEISGDYAVGSRGHVYDLGVPIRIMHLDLEDAPDDEELD